MPAGYARSPFQSGYGRPTDLRQIVTSIRARLRHACLARTDNASHSVLVPLVFCRHRRPATALRAAFVEPIGFDDPINPDCGRSVSRWVVQIERACWQPHWSPCARGPTVWAA